MRTRWMAFGVGGSCAFALLAATALATNSGSEFATTVGADEESNVWGGCGNYTTLANGACTTTQANTCVNGTGCPWNSCKYTCTPVNTQVNGNTSLNYNLTTTACAGPNIPQCTTTVNGDCSCSGAIVPMPCAPSQQNLGAKCGG